MNWLHYLLEANLYLAVFYIAYFLFLRNDTHYTLNRAYLLATAAISFVIPLLQLGFLKPVVPQPIAITLTPIAQYEVTHYNIAPAEVVHFTWQDGLVWAYLLGVAVLFIIFSVKIYQLIRLTKAAKSQIDDDYKLIYLDDSNTAFSFFHFLFIGTKASGADTIIQHELVHIRHKHSADILFVELLKIVNWFNPFVYLLQASIKTLHEYIADEQTAANSNDVIAYSTFLVNNAYGLGGSSITHSFFNYNLLKRRIIMLNQQRSGNLARLKYLLSLPICAGLLCASTLAFSKSYSLVDIAPASKSDTPKHVHVVVNNDVMSYDKKYTTVKGYDVAEAIRNNNGVISRKVVVTDENGSKHTYYNEKISTAERKMLLNKYGYKFPVGTFSDVTLLPPPPAVDHSPPPPPAPPASDDLTLLSNYLQKTLTYPADAKSKMQTGNVSITFKLDNDHKITDVKVIHGAGHGFDEAVVQAISGYPAKLKPIDGFPGYLFGVIFRLSGSKDNVTTNITIIGAHRPTNVGPTKTTKLVQDWQLIPGFFTRSGKGC